MDQVRQDGFIGLSSRGCSDVVFDDCQILDDVLVNGKPVKLLT